MFNLLRLHKKEEDIFPESWIGLEGKGLGELVKKVVTEILTHNKKLSYHAICNAIAQENNVCVNMVRNYLKKNYIVIPLLNSLVSVWSKELKKGENEIREIKNQILINTEMLKVNNPSSPKIVALKDLNERLAFLVGAHAADGMINLHITFSGKNKSNVQQIKKEIEMYLGREYKNVIYKDNYNQTYQFGISVNNSLNKRVISFVKQNQKIKERKIKVKREYRWKITDYYAIPLEIIKNDLYRLFGLKLRIKREKEANAYTLETKNKLLIRYLHIFFNCPYGKKSRIIDEPQIIKKSGEKNRLAFARGVFTFDGSVNRDKTVKLQIYSHNLSFSLRNILSQHSINFSHCKTKRGSYQIQSSGDIVAWLKVIEEKTEKWSKLKSLIEGCYKTGTKNETEFTKQLSEIYPTNGVSKLDITTLLISSKTLKKFGVKEFSNYISSIYNIKATANTILKNLEILARSGVVSQTKEKQFFMRLKGNKKGTKGAVLKNVFVFNPDYKEWKLPY